jgi:predicted AAA+ superfamily ATPase
MFNRIINLDLPKGQSAFLWGARNTGKSTYLHAQYPNAVFYDLLETDLVTRLLANPHLLREELIELSSKLTSPVIIDEIQKVPELLNEVHWLIEQEKIGFVLCGSSARKLKRGAANLLGGRAWGFNFYPLVYKEIPDFDLIKALNQGLLPTHYLTEYPERTLRAYVNTYLKEEIQAEGLVRNLPGFARFLDLLGFANGEMVNYSNIARDCAIDSKTVKEYFHIVVDTLIGYLITPFHKKIKRDLIATTPKFYLFDVGIANYLTRKKIGLLRGSDAGKAFQHFILMEIIACLGLNEIDDPVQYWRSKSGLEVDFVLGNGEVAIEVKISESPTITDLKGLSAFCDDYQPRHAIVVSQAPRRRLIKTASGQNIQVLPWQEFLQALWERKFF